MPRPSAAERRDSAERRRRAELPSDEAAERRKEMSERRYEAAELLPMPS